jgi:protein-tyrosine phosphatase
MSRTQRRERKAPIGFSLKLESANILRVRVSILLSADSPPEIADMPEIPPLADTHCHLLAGLDDGPRTPDDAIAMCRKAHEQGVRHSIALAHQNDDYPDNTPARIQQAFAKLQADLNAANLPHDVIVGSEVMVRTDVMEALDRKELLTFGNAGKYLLFEMPHGMCVEVGWLIERFIQKGVRPILAHAERCPELLEDPELPERLVRLGCLIQVSSMGITRPASREAEKALKDWFRRGIAHIMGSDGHSLHRRPPDMRDAYLRVRSWAGQAVADRVASSQGIAVLRGLPVQTPPVSPPEKRWFAKFW